LNTIKWIAELSNGEIIEEQWEDGKLSPWLQLKKHCEENGLGIKRLKLCQGDKVYYAGEKLDDSRFSSAIKPVGYIAGKKEEVQLVPEIKTLARYAYIGAVYGPFAFLIWLGEDNEVWTEVRTNINKYQIIQSS